MQLQLHDPAVRTGIPPCARGPVTLADLAASTIAAAAADFQYVTRPSVRRAGKLLPFTLDDSFLEPCSCPPHQCAGLPARRAFADMLEHGCPVKLEIRPTAGGMVGALW